MTTFYDLSLRSNAEVWRSIRSRRADPPVPAGSYQRKTTFQSALQQAEQQFRAAALIDYDSRALNLYYGLSQAGRAIGAASSALPDDGWRLKHHGLSVDQLDSIGPDIAAVRVKTIGKDDTSFRRLSIVFDSDQPAVATLGDVWPLIYDTQFGPKLTDPLFVPITVDLQSAHLPSGAFVAQAANDFHPNQRGQHPGPIPGTIWIHGNLYIDRIPENMKVIDPPPRFPTTDQKVDAQEKFDRRKPYAFTALSKRDKAGYQRLKGPALAGHVRCPNVPKSMRLTYDHPNTNCVKGDPCACGTTVTVSPDMSPRERQTHAWGTTDWAAAYYRRSAIESTNAELKVHRMKLGRGYTRVVGLIKNTLLLAFGITGMNVMMLRTWHAKRFLPDPWAVALHETDLGDGGGSREAATRARRRTRTYADIGVAPPPDDGPAAPGGTYTEVTA